MRMVTCGDGRGWDVLPPAGMQGVRSSNLLSSTQLRSKIRTARTKGYSGKVQQRRPDGSPYVCSDQASSVVRAAGKSARSKPAQRCYPGRELGKLPRSPWSMTLAARFPAGHCGGGVSDDCCRVCRWSPCCGPRHPRSTPGPAPVTPRCQVRGSRPWSRTVAPDGASVPVRCAAQAPG